MMADWPLLLPTWPIEAWLVMRAGVRRREGEMGGTPGTECSGERMLPADEKDSHRITS